MQPSKYLGASNSLEANVEIRREAELVLGERGWFLISVYGRLMSGPHSGRYVSGVSYSLQYEVVRRLAAGETLPIHLMHAHRSGNYEVSALRWSRGQLVMVYGDREVCA